MSGGTELLMSFNYKGYLVEVDGVWDKETALNDFDFYEVFLDGECITLGNLLFKKPSKQKVKILVNKYLKEI
jgi:hypothetical protein